MWAGPGAHTSSPMRGEEAGCLPRESNPDAAWRGGVNPGASTCSATRADPGPPLTQVRGQVRSRFARRTPSLIGCIPPGMQRTPECFHGPLVAGKPQQNPPHSLVVDVLDGLQREAQGLVGPDTPLASFGMMADLGGPREKPRRGALAQCMELIELDQLLRLASCFRVLATGREGLSVWLPACGH